MSNSGVLPSCVSSSLRPTKSRTSKGFTDWRSHIVGILFAKDLDEHAEIRLKLSAGRRRGAHRGAYGSFPTRRMNTTIQYSNRNGYDLSRHFNQKTIITIETSYHTTNCWRSSARLIRSAVSHANNENCHKSQMKGRCLKLVTCAPVVFRSVFVLSEIQYILTNRIIFVCR